MYLLEVFDDEGRSQGFLSSVDFEANAPNYPTGSADATCDADKALKFDSAREALAFTLTVSEGRPLRPDGQPNRPLRSMNLCLVPLRQRRAR